MKKTIGLIAILIVISSCANHSQEEDISKNIHTKQSKTTTPVVAHRRQDSATIMSDYALYMSALDDLKLKNTAMAYHFLATQGQQNNSMVEKIRLGLLKRLGQESSWSAFIQQYELLPKETEDMEVNCYAAIAGYTKRGISLVKMAKELIKSNERLPEGCNKMIETAVMNGGFHPNDIWRRIRILISHGELTLARSLADTIGQPISKVVVNDGTKASKIAKIIPMITFKGRNRPNVEKDLGELYDSGVDQDDIGFVEGIVGLSKARDIEMSSALKHFEKSDKIQLSYEQWEWYARSALRLNQWLKLLQIIETMPKEVSETPTWWYWLGRAKSAIGDKPGARMWYEKAARSGRNYYAILAHEELGWPLNVQSDAMMHDQNEILNIKNNHQIERALILFKKSLTTGDRDMRKAAQEQWRYAIRGFSDKKLIRASELALQNLFYEMSILSADLSDGILNYQLRFPMPYKNIIDKYSNIYGIESAWVLGVIRQESRFMTAAKSYMGASGLMQIMPATARMIAKKIELEHYDIHDMETNINMGVWYLADLYTQFGSEPLATSAYNAGAGRVNRWRQNGLEGAIYVETIPFNETRNYVKKVMSNTVYYSHLFGLAKKTLKTRLGVL